MSIVSTNSSLVTNQDESFVTFECYFCVWYKQERAFSTKPWSLENTTCRHYRHKFSFMITVGEVYPYTFQANNARLKLTSSVQYFLDLLMRVVVIECEMGHISLQRHNIVVFTLIGHAA